MKLSRIFFHAGRNANDCRLLVENVKVQLGRPTHRGEDNIKTNMKQNAKMLTRLM
jgi:hypothetical protein